jgi:UDP-N-acetylmuramate: L-alanyl-gamma-D-glutamyl-meso-diaminopimelate ligase
MSTLLSTAGIAPMLGYDAAHLQHPTPDLVIVGNAVARANVEAQETERLGLARLSMPEALARFFLADRSPLVVAGTHGKTTTTALAAWVYTRCGAQPGFLIGGLPRDLGRSFERGSGPRFIVEGDEYNAAYFDRGPKFLHYRPQTLILTSVEYDHADLYPSPEALRDAYRTLIALLPASGLIAACGDDPELRELVRAAPCRVRLYGTSQHCDVRLTGVEATPEGGRFRFRDGEDVEALLGVWGEHNATNALAVWCVARADGLDRTDVLAALRSFRGVRRRQEEVGVRGGTTVIDDFAHHPTAVRKTIAALRQHYPGQRLCVVFEPRSLTAGRAFFFDAYVEAFAAADAVVLAPLFHAGRLAEEERLDLPRLVAALGARGARAVACASIEQTLATAVAEARSGGVVVTMSSGAFGDMPRQIVRSL